jgi:hypothetical protein
LLNQSECIFSCTNDTVCNAACRIAHSIICTWLFRGKMHSDWFKGIEILQGRWQHGENVGYCYPSGLEKTLYNWDIYVSLVTKELSQLKVLVGVWLIQRHVTCLLLWSLVRAAPTSASDCIRREREGALEARGRISRVLKPLTHGCELSTCFSVC